VGVSAWRAFDVTESERQQLAEWKRRAEVAEEKLLLLRMAAQEVLLDLQGRRLPISREREQELLRAVEAAR
jgi:hypothetical protein